MNWRFFLKGTNLHAQVTQRGDDGSEALTSTPPPVAGLGARPEMVLLCCFSIGIFAWCGFAALGRLSASTPGQRIRESSGSFPIQLEPFSREREHSLWDLSGVLSFYIRLYFTMFCQFTIAQGLLFFAAHLPRLFFVCSVLLSLCKSPFEREKDRYFFPHGIEESVGGG